VGKGDFSADTIRAPNFYNGARAMEEVTAWATAEVAELDTEETWAEATAGAGATAWPMDVALAAEDRDAARDMDTDRECVRGAALPDILVITAGDNNQALAAPRRSAASATRMPSCLAVVMPNSSFIMSSL